MQNNDHEARRRIHQAQLKADGVIDLSDLQLTQLPQLPDTTTLKSLDIGNNRLSQLPDWMANLTQLTELRLYGNRLTELPDWMANLTNLTGLDLSRNQFNELPDWMANLTQLTELRLYGNRLTELPDWMANLTNLTGLDIDGSQLSRLPEWMASFTSLTMLDIRNNRLTELPDWMVNLTKLTDLTISSNQLRTLPDWMAQLTELTSLNISSNQLRTLPDWMAQLTELTSLNISSNQLRTLPEWMAGLTGLTTLNISSNRLTELPEWMASLTGLTTLNTGFNQLRTLPDWMAQLTELSSLNISSNQLRTLPEWMAGLTGLTTLNISSNQLTELPEWMASLTGLTTLNTGFNQLRTLPDWMAQLTELTSLNISSNQLGTLPDWMAQLTELTNLNISRNQLGTLPEWMASLTGLTNLYLSNNQLDILPDWIAGLTRLKYLTVSSNRLTELPEWMAGLTGLIDLDISRNQLGTLREWMAGLTGLTSLDISSNQLGTLPEWMAGLTGLTSLDISSNQLGTLPEWMAGLTGLTSLYLSNNQLGTLPEWMAGLTGLTNLDISRNQLGTLPEWMAGLTGLTNLYLSDNQIGTLPDWIAGLTGLNYLYLSNNQLVALPDGMAALTGLTMLDISGNQIGTLPDWIAGLTGLNYLYLSNNQLAALPDGMAALTTLTNLDISNNQLAALPDGMAALTTLTNLDISNNQLRVVPDWLVDLAMLQELFVHGNLSISPPPEIASSGTQSVLAFLRARREGASEQWVSKLLIVGEGGVGKTSLIKALTRKPHDPGEPTTHGLQISHLPIKHPHRTDITMKLSAWDFGGQHIYHATHQFFITDRSLFLLLWNARLGWEQGKLRYWLDIITARAPKSPIFLVATHADQNERPVDLPLDELRRDYPRIVNNFAVDSETRTGVTDLSSSITEEATSLPLMGAEWPTAWLASADALRALTEKHITPGRMWEIMSRAGVTDQAQQKYIAIAMHQLGDILYYHDDEELSQTVVLQPEWVNDYISKVLDSPHVATCHGLLTRDHLNELWWDLDRGLRDHFLGMMDKYDLSYQIDGGRRGDISLVVERLPWNPPPYHQSWEKMAEIPGMKEIKVLYRLNTMPPGIPTWFIARSHRFTTNHHWRAGALLQHSDNTHRALLRADHHRNVVELAVRGPAPAAFFSILDDGLNRTLERFPGLDITRQVPCPCQGASVCPELFDYDDLQSRLLRNPPRHEIECRKSGDLLDVPMLILGLTPSERDVARIGLDRLTKIITESTRKQDEQTEYMQRMFLKLQRISQAQQEVRCPSVFSLTSVPRNRFKGSAFELRLYCEEPGAWHPLSGDDGCYQIKELPNWLHKISPYLKYLVAILKHTAPFVGPILGMTVDQLDQQTKAEADAMKELISQIPESMPREKNEDLGDVNSHAESRATLEADFRALEALLIELDPARTWGGLSRTTTPEGLTLYLCAQHSHTYRGSGAP